MFEGREVVFEKKGKEPVDADMITDSCAEISDVESDLKSLELMLKEMEEIAGSPEVVTLSTTEKEDFVDSEEKCESIRRFIDFHCYSCSA